MPIAWSLDPIDAPPLDDLEGAVAGAFEAWSRVDGTDVTFLAEDAGSMIVAESRHDLFNFVYFDPAWPDDEEALALASTWSSTEGILLGFDIRLDASAAWSTTGDAGAYDLQAALTHEIGHTLGLEHSDLVDATMFGVHARGEDWRRILHVDDEDALRHLYGQRVLDPEAGGALLEGDPQEPFTTASAACGTVPPTPWNAVLGLPLLTILWRRRVTNV